MVFLNIARFPMSSPVVILNATVQCKKRRLLESSISHDHIIAFSIVHYDMYVKEKRFYSVLMYIFLKIFVPGLDDCKQHKKTLQGLVLIMLMFLCDLKTNSYPSYPSFTFYSPFFGIMHVNLSIHK